MLNTVGQIFSGLNEKLISVLCFCWHPYFSFLGLEMVQFVKYLIGIVLFSAFIVCRDPQGSWKDNTNWDTLIFPVRTGTLAYSRIVNNNEKKPVLSYQQPEKDAVSIATGEATNTISKEGSVHISHCVSIVAS